MAGKTEEEKAKRKARAKRRREAKAAGTYVPRGERKAKRRKDLASAVSAKVSRRPTSKEEKERTVRKQHATQQDRIRRSTGWEPEFKSGEPVLVKARIIRPAYPTAGKGRYFITPIVSLSIPGEGRGWYITEQHLTRWPRRKK